MVQILDEILKDLPKGIISDSVFEGANIILYTKDKEFFLNKGDIIREIVGKIKKRIELRPDPSITMELEKAEEFIRSVIPAEAILGNVQFDPQRSIVVIGAEKPGIAIGKQGEILKEIRRKTFWVPNVERTPAIESKIIENVRSVLFQNNDYRKKFLHKVGLRIYNGYTKERKEEWIRVTFFGAGRQVGRSCIFLQTPESKILLDCGVNVAFDDYNAYPLLDSPEFKIEDLDAIIITHSHIDHGGFVPFLYKMGFRGPTYCTAPTRDISALLALDYIGVAFKQARKNLYDVNDIKEMVKHTITLNWEEVTDITPDMRLTLYNSGHILGSSMAHLHIGNGLHNLVYSLDWKTPVTTLDKHNEATFEPIGKIVDQAIKKHPELVNKKGDVEEIPNVDGLKTFAFNPHTLKTEVAAITKLLRHPIKEDLYEIRTASGRQAIVTKSHSVFTIDEGKLHATKASDLNVGDFIIGPKKVPQTQKKPVIDLLPYAPDLRVFIDSDALAEQRVDEYRKKFHVLHQHDARDAVAWIFDHIRHGMYKGDIARKYHVHCRRISRTFKQLGIVDYPRAFYPLPHQLPITPDFARFLGYYVAEGDRRKNSQTIAVSNYSLPILQDCFTIIKKEFGIEGNLREQDGVILFHSKQLKYLVSKILKCGDDAYHKRAPACILHADKDIMKNFLYGYFSGDGGIRTREKGREISAGSKNKQLIQDITFMLLQFGLVPTLEYNRTTQMHNAHLYQADKIGQFLKEIGMHNGSTSLLQHEITSRKLKSSFDMRIPIISLSKKAQLSLSRTQWRDAQSCGIPILRAKQESLTLEDKRLVESDLMFDQILSLKKVKPSSSYVYDFTVEGFENFMGGEGFLFLHNTGDMKYLKTQVLDPAVTDFPRLETMIIESTYGGKDDILGSRREAELKFISKVNETIKRGGKILIPVLGVGRSQEVMLIVEKAIREGLIERIPVYVQGMVWDITAIHTAYPDFLNRELRKAIFHRDQDPFLSDIFKKVGSRKEQQQIMDEGGPCVILATAGMLNAGASLEYFKQMAGNPKNTIMFVSYLGEGTIGRKVQNGDKTITLQGDEGKPENIHINLEIATITELTGHAGRNELLRFVHDLNPKPKRIIVNHGEASKCLELASSLHKINNIETNAPKNLETIRIR